MTQQQVPGISRTDLQRHDLSVPGREVIQSRVDISPEAPFIRHTHPGEEIIYVIEGTLEYEVDGMPSTTLNEVDVLTVPAETVHAVRNVGAGNAAELATYVVEKGKPLLSPAD
jgi:quercetin dioxygenase-like cupin family protein